MKKLIITFMSGLMISAGAFAQGRRPGAAQVKAFSNLEEVKQELSKMEKANTFSGVVLIEKDGEILHHQAYGYASKEEEKKNRLNTKINIGSINKFFTQIAVMQLVEAGKLELDGKVKEHIPELSMEMSDKITLRHLLTMSSGLGFYWSHPEYVENWRDFRKMEDYLAIIKDAPLSFEPGTSRQYSNSGYELLGILVERVSGESYYDYVDKNVYQRAGLKNTGAYESDKNVSNRADGYTNYAEGESMGPGSSASGSGFTINNRERHSIIGTAAGGGYSTAEDFQKVAHALWENKLIGEKYTDMIFNRYQKRSERNPFMAFGGGSIGINAMLMADFEQGYVIAVLANYDPPTASDLARKLQKSIAEGRF